MNKLIIVTALSISSLAFGAKMTADQAKAATAKECQAKYKETQGKSADEILEWIETEERGANAKAFKKSKCYALHEKLEGLANNHEEGEEGEHK
jgi:hypothetical protein